MAVTLVQLSLLLIIVIQLTSSQSTYDVTQQDGDVTSCGSNEQVLSQLVTSVSQLVTSNSQLRDAVSQLMATNSQLQRDVTELKTGSRQNDTAGDYVSGLQIADVTIFYA